MAKDKDLPVSREVWQAVCDLKQAGGYASVDETLRPILGLAAGPRPFLKGAAANVASA